MNQHISTILLLLIPAVAGGIVALTNSTKVNEFSERLEGWTRRRQGIVSAKKGFFWKWIVHPPLRVIVKLCDWTDSLAHRGLKNGIRIAAALYILGFWLLLLIYAFMFVLALICVAVGLVIALWIVGHMLGDKSESNAPAWSPRTKGSNEDQDNMSKKSEASISFSIRIVNDKGEGVSGVRVYVQYNVFGGSATDETDDGGWAHFTQVGFDEMIMQRTTLKEIGVKGTTIAKDVTVNNGDTLSYTLPHTFWG